MYVYQTKIKLHETDAAGLLFFSNQFKIIHDAYESLLETIGYDFAQLIRDRDIFLPIVHAESDYRAPLFVGDAVSIQVSVDKIGKTSFSLAYKLLNAKQKLVGTGRTVHVAVNKSTRKKIILPKDLRTKIQKLSKQKCVS